MRRAGGAWAVLLCVAAAGCVGGPFQPGGLFSPWIATKADSEVPGEGRQRSVGGFGNAFGNSLAAEAVPGLYVESVLFERPAGDPFITREIWQTDASGLAPKSRVLLEENGIRVAVIGGNLPPAFLRMIESNEGAVNPQGLTFASRTEAVLPTIGPIEKCEFELLPDLTAERERKTLTGAHGGIQIQPKKSPDGRIVLHCEPQVQHGEKQDRIVPVSDDIGFTLKSELPLERFPSLGFDVMLAPGEYLVVGWHAGEPSQAVARAAHSLGAMLFCTESRREPRQRILVVRAGDRGRENAGVSEPITRAAHR